LGTSDTFIEADGFFTGLMPSPRAWGVTGGSRRAGSFAEGISTGCCTLPTRFLDGDSGLVLFDSASTRCVLLDLLREKNEYLYEGIFEFVDEVDVADNLLDEPA
jgi:hypothetical protein